MDNIFIERLWRSVKYEEIYLKAYDNGSHARRELDTYFRYYNQSRHHQGLDRKTPDHVYHGNKPRFPAEQPRQRST